MGKVSAHFNRGEFACKCGCGFAAVDIELLAVLEDLRRHYNAPIRISSACRCARHNANVGGETRSMHMCGMAADFTIDNVPPGVIADRLEEKFPNRYGIGRYASWVHVDVREGKARWTR